MEEDKSYKWTQLAKYLASESSRDEERELECQIRIDKETEEEFVSAQKSWDEASYSLLYQSIDSEKAFNNVKQMLSPTVPVRRFSTNQLWMGIAASLAFFVMSWALWNSHTHSSEQIVNKELIVASNQTHSVVLNDGTKVDLNGGSQFAYPNSFEGNKREVVLKGEAFFNVAANKEKPFLINAGPVVVRVVGTKFNVKAFDNQLIEVVVEEGVVEVTGKSETVVLTKGYRAAFDRQSGILVKSLNENPNFNAWNTRQIIFKETSLNEVATILKDVYKVNVVIDDSLLLNRKLSATFHDQSIDYVLDVVSRTFHLNYEFDNGAYHLKKS